MGWPLGRVARQAVLVMLGWQAAASVCDADIVHFTTGRTFSVKAHRYDGDRIVLVLRGGGEVVCSASTVVRVTPDEVPFPEPEAAASNVPAPLPAVPFGEVIDRAAERAGIDPRLVRAVIQVESAFQPQARSPKGAMGLMQLMPATARQYAVKNPYDPVANIEAGVQHLKGLLERLELPLALAAYNAGEAAVERYRGVPPYPETQQYVRQVLQLVGSTR